MRHVKTWRGFIDNLTVMGTDRFTEHERVAMAEALSFAVPHGPTGVPCLDGCGSHDSDATAILTSLEVLERALSVQTMSAVDRADLRLALGDSERKRGQQLFPNVWKLIGRLLA